MSYETETANHAQRRGTMPVMDSFAEDIGRLDHSGEAVLDVAPEVR
jgi:hypothetical protein